MLYLISRLLSGRHFPESRHIVDRTLFQIALCASQFRVWNRYHIMSPVSVCTLFLHSFPSETSQEHCRTLQPGVFDLCCSENQGTGDRVNARRWLVDLSSSISSSEVEHPPCAVTSEILLNIIHKHQSKIRQKKIETYLLHRKFSL